MSPNITLSWVLALAPEISLLVVLFMVLVFDKLFKPDNPRLIGQFTAWGALAVLLITVGLYWLFGQPNAEWTLLESTFWGGMIRNDLVTFVFRIMFLSALVLTALVSIDVPRLQKLEYYALLITATIGFSLMAASTDLIMIYVALETASISSYLLAGFYSGQTRSAEAGMKYFVFGAFTTAVMLYGMSMLYGVTGQTNLYLIGNLFSTQNISIVQPLLLLAAVLILVGFGFKTSLVPYHFWTPDVYEGAPTPFTGFLSTASKAAGFAVLLRVFLAGVLGPAQTSSEWWAMLVAICIITMSLGNLVAIFQTNIKRLLAYSTIAHAGYVLMGVAAISTDKSGDGAAAVAFYMFMYVLSNMLAFAVVILFTRATGSEQIRDLAGFSRRSPWLGLAMTLALLSLAGIPPAAGFVGKFLLFRAAVDAGLVWLALVAVANVIVGLYYYLIIVKVMYMEDSPSEEPVPVDLPFKWALAISAAGVLLFGTILVTPLLDWATDAAHALYVLL